MEYCYVIHFRPDDLEDKLLRVHYWANDLEEALTMFKEQTYMHTNTIESIFKHS